MSNDQPDDHAGDDATRASGDAPTRIDNQADAPTRIADEQTAPATGAPGNPSQQTTVTELRAGHVLKDRFRLEKKLGAGAMGAVFRAVDQRRVETQHHDPNIAIKLIGGDFAADSRAFIALQRETDKSQTLAHPNIITVYDFDRDGDIFFMTMESLTGITLDEHIRRGDADRKQTLGYIADLANAIAYAHQRNIVHSDLKPQNIFITDEGSLKVLDFGIARAFSAMDEADAPTSDPGEIVGLTPAYASCEMFQREEPHPADDVYAIGLIAYEMLTGEHPFARKKAVDARAEGARPKRIKGLAGYQWRAISKALAFERADRWPDAEAFRRKFTGTGRRVRQLTAALLIALASFGAYMALYQPEKGPDIPFEQLPAATQQKFNKTLSEGQEAQKFNDINGALFYFDKAYTLHPRDPRVMKEINRMLDEILARMDTDAPRQQLRQDLQQIKELQKYESLQQNPRLTARKKALQQQLEQPDNS